MAVDYDRRRKELFNAIDNMLNSFSEIKGEDFLNVDSIIYAIQTRLGSSEAAIKARLKSLEKNGFIVFSVDREAVKLAKRSLVTEKPEEVKGGW